MKDLGCVGWFLDDDIRCGWDDVLLLELTLCWDHKSLSFIWVFGELFARTQGVRMYWYAYWTIGGFMSVMNIWMVNIWYYNL